MPLPPPPSPIALVSLKAYFGHARTLAWFDRVVELVEAGRAAGVTLVVVPSATALVTLAGPAQRTGIVLGAQDCSRFGPGAWTGEVPATLLAEVGAQVVEVGHAERRQHLGDADDVVAAKVRAVLDANLVPMLCVGERERGPAAGAAAVVVSQLESALAGAPASAPVLVAYEPVWAIGAERPAPTDHVLEVATRVRRWIARYPAGRLIYGGTAGPGTYRDLAPVLDGLGLGRRVHDVAALGVVLEEMRQAHDGTERGSP